MSSLLDMIAPRQGEQATNSLSKIAQQERGHLSDAIRMAEFSPADFEGLQTELPEEYRIALASMPEESSIMKLAEEMEERNAATNIDPTNLDVPPSVDVQQRDEIIDAITSVERDNRVLLERNNELQEEKAHLLKQNNEYQARIDRLTERNNDLQELNNSHQEAQIQLAHNKRRRDWVGLGMAGAGIIASSMRALMIGEILLAIGIFTIAVGIAILCWRGSALSNSTTDGAV